MSALVFRSFAEIVDDVRVNTDSELIYYLTVKEDGVDAQGVESSDAQMAYVRGGRVTVTDKIPNGLEFQGFVTTSDGTFGAVSRADGSVQCSGKVIDDTNEVVVDSGTWNNGHSEYYYHGLHYDASTRTVSFAVEKITAGCGLTVGIITKTPASVDDPDTTPVETRRDFYNTAFAAEKDVAAISNTVHAYIGNSSVALRTVRYAYTGVVPAGAPTVPSEESYAQYSMVPVNMEPTLEGYTFSGWTTSDVTVNDGTFEMPGQDVQLVGVWTKNAEQPKYTVTYVVNGEKPGDFMPPATREYEADVSVQLDSTEADANIDGYRFLGWSTTDAELSGAGFTMPEQNVIIAGSFERISYTVCYEFESATVPPDASSILPPCETHYPGDTVTTAGDPVSSGYEFMGWYKGSSFAMPEENVVIRGEWSRAVGKFAPTITKTIVEAKTEYVYGETVKFKVTVTNTAAFEITDVYLQEELDGAVFTAPDDGSYAVRTSTVAVIPSIAAGASVDVNAEYKVTENAAQTLVNTVELMGALAEDNALDTEQEYLATVSFNTIPEPAPFTGVVFNALPYVGLIALGVGAIFIGIMLSRRIGNLATNLGRIHNLDMHRTLRYSLPCFAIVGALVGGIIAKNASAEHYTEIIKSIELTSQQANYANNEPGAWNVVKSAKWIGENRARIIFDVDTVAKPSNDEHLDVVMVLDNSGSMEGNQLAQVKSDASELAESILVDTESRIALVSFNSSATVRSGFTNDKTTLLTKIDQLNAGGDTNYYAGLLKAEEVLGGYVRRADRGLVLLFLTDGCPNEQTPNEVAEYRLLKRMYPYMVINGIQYEMGDEVRSQIRDVSDNQFIADVDSLKNVLFEASVAPYVYENFTIVDYINSEYWDVDSIDAIEASIGNASLTHEGNVPVVTWTMSEELLTGRSVQLTIDITLKNAGAIEDDTFLPTNDHEIVQSSLLGAPNENISSELTPVLKSSYKVTYEANLPSECSAYGGILPTGQDYLPMSIVQKSVENLSCDGYNFAGWDIASGEPKIINDDHFKILHDDVVLRATWVKLSISKSLGGSVVESPVAVLDTGKNVNVMMKQLSGQSDATFSATNSTIKAVRSANSMSSIQQQSALVISAADSPIPAYAWYDGTEEAIYIFSDADMIKTNPDTSQIFRGFSALTDISGIASWQTADSTNMDALFYNCSSIVSVNALSGWDTSNATSMEAMFRGASDLTDISGLSDWEVSNVESMLQMFYNTTKLADISALSDWDTSSLTSMRRMFYGDSSLTDVDGLGGWDTSHVTDMNCLFIKASNLADISALSGWNTSSVTDMDWTFGYASKIADISALASWDTSSVITMASAFYNLSKITDINALSGWDVSNAENISYLFYGATSLTDVSALSNWDVSSVTNMNSLFYAVTKVSDFSSVSGWDVSNVTDMGYAFSHTYSLKNLNDLSGWDVSSVTNMYAMFSVDTALLDISGIANWDVSSVTDTRAMFSDVNKVTDISALAGWNVSSLIDMGGMFQRMTSITNLDALANWNISSVTSLRALFYKDTSLANISGIANWSTSGVTDMVGIFYGCSGVSDISALSNWNTSSAASMSAMFQEASGITNINALSNWNTSNVTNMSSMFQGATSLANIEGARNWNVSNVTNVDSMFKNDANITSLEPIDGWNTANITSKNETFDGIPDTVQRPSWY